MKIEKLNENQIRCTLTKSDLTDRELKISELAYGSDKAKVLFKDMMEQASYECGFEADDIPLMIEAVPVNSDCIVLTITKVEDPEELDTRFSKFSPSIEEDLADNEYLPETKDEMMNLFHKVKNSTKKPTDNSKGNGVTESNSIITRVYQFKSFSDVIKLSHVVSNIELGNNSLYKDTTNQQYWLVTSNKNTSVAAFNKLCNILSEYGRFSKNSHEEESYFIEHYEVICKDKALQNLINI